MAVTTTGGMTQSEYGLWRDLLRRHYGLDFPENRAIFLARRLGERMGQVGVRSFAEYYHKVTAELRGGGPSRELDAALEQVLNHQSEFFRHNASYDALAQKILPEIMAIRRAQGSHSVSIWSAGCSAGQEPYSLAMITQEIPVPRDRPVRFEILATDVGKAILARAAEATYADREIGHLPDAFKRRYMTPTGVGTALRYKVSDEIRQKVKFAYLNLAEPGEYPVLSQDVIFCQNVLIYFDADDRRRVVERLCRRLRPGGSLFLGPAEYVGVDIPGFRPVALDGIFILQRSS